MDLRMAALFALGALGLYAALGLRLAQGQYFDFYNLAFDFDPPRSVAILALEEHERGNVKHPLFVLLRPLAWPLLAAGFAPKQAAALVMAGLGAATVGVVFLYLRSLAVATGTAAALALLFAVSSCQVITSTIPEAYGPAALGIVGHVDLRAGARAAALLEAHVAAGQGRFKGIRHSSAWHPDPAAKGSSTSPPPGLLLDADFRAGFACLAPLGLTFDAWMFHTQLAELRDLADAFPSTKIVLDHVGGPLNIGPYHARQPHVMREWRASMQALAALPNVHIKLGGFGMRLFNCDCYGQELPPSSEQLAAAWRPYIEWCVQVFGAGRCTMGAT
jgi:predicted TIM-barrel fold metal-dependent hydrolase